MKNIYHSNIESYKKRISGLTKDLKQISIYRMMLFAFSAFLIILFANAGLAVAVWLVIPICGLGFIPLINHANKITYQKEHAAFLKEINEQEILRLETKLSDLPNGKNHIKLDHPYSADLDVFGSHSLFQLINRTTTESGGNCLAAWLSESGSNDVILQRQEAIQELSPKLEWRQDFQASGMHFINAKSDYNKLLAWLEQPVALLSSQSKHLAVCVLLSLVSTSATVYFVVHLCHFLLGIHPFSLGYISTMFVAFFINYLVSRKFKPIAGEILENTYFNTKILGGYRTLIIKIESEKFNSKMLQRLQSVVTSTKYSAADEINTLRKILETFQLRGVKGKSTGRNFLYSILNILWLLDIYWIIMAEKWKQKNSTYLKSWADAVNEFETLSSIAGFAYSNPSFTYPEIKKEAFTIHFEMIGHPLISPEKRICNQFDLEGYGKIAMITGSNMAGKSTFLRTLGANMVLALMGAPCCAKSGKVSNVKIFSSMRTQDNLEEGVSSFYAELKRIELLLELIASGEPTFFLLDEIFKGTNSKDRYRGGFSLIKQLQGLNTFGIISTHDLDLAILAGEHKLVDNFSFNSEIRESELVFDYKLTNGLCRDFNASELMRRSGIKVLNNIE